MVIQVGSEPPCSNLFNRRRKIPTEGGGLFFVVDVKPVYVTDKKITDTVITTSIPTLMANPISGCSQTRSKLLAATLVKLDSIVSALKVKSGKK